MFLTYVAVITGTHFQTVHLSFDLTSFFIIIHRAPELIFGAIDYTTKIDVWSAGCVLAELLLGQPIFPGDSGVDQLVEIIKVLGTPTREQIREMNPNYTEFKFPQIKSHPWQQVSHHYLSGVDDRNK